LEFADTEKLLKNMEIPNSLIEQIQFLTPINVTSVYPCIALFNTQNGAACRLIIGLMFANAIRLAKLHLEAGSIALFQDVNFEHPDLAGVGPIGGSLDFLSSNVIGTRNVAKYGDFARPSRPHLLIVEAKNSTNVGTTNALAQVLAQLLTLHYHDPYISWHQINV
jgi:hypothetical protein